MKVNLRLCQWPRIQYGVDISGMPGSWPGGKGLVLKKHRPGEPSSRGCARFPQKEAGPWAIHRIAPTRIQPKDVVLTLCPPVPWNQRRLMVSARKALAPGPGNRGKANKPLIEGELSFVGVIHDQSGGEGCKFDQLA